MTAAFRACHRLHRVQLFERTVSTLTGQYSTLLNVYNASPSLHDMSASLSKSLSLLVTSFIPESRTDRRLKEELMGQCHEILSRCVQSDRVY